MGEQLFPLTRQGKDVSTPIETVVFDLDDTICEYRRSGAEILSLAFESADVEPFFTIEEYGPIADELVTDSDSVVENRRRSFARLAERAGRDPQIGRAVADAYAAERDPTNVQWVPGAEAALDHLDDSYDLVLVTNGGPREQRAKLRELGIVDRFEAVVYAGYDTAPKPEPEPLERALDAVGTPPTRAVNVGDSLRLDVLGAHNAGLRSVWLDQSEGMTPEPVPDYRIESMRELLAEPWADPTDA